MIVFSFMFPFSSVTLYSLIPHGAVSSLRVVKTERRKFIVFTALTDKRSAHEQAQQHHVYTDLPRIARAFCQHRQQMSVKAAVNIYLVSVRTDSDTHTHTHLSLIHI